MDVKEKKIVNLLVENARYTDKQLSSITGIAEQEVKKIIARLEKDGIIVKYSAVINAAAASEKIVQAMIEVKVAPQKLKGFDAYAEDLYDFPEVKSLYLMSGGFDLAVFVECKDISCVAKFVAEKLSVIEGITGVQTHFILKKYKIEGQITNPKKEHARLVIQA